MVKLTCTWKSSLLIQLFTLVAARWKQCFFPKEMLEFVTETCCWHWLETPYQKFASWVVLWINDIFASRRIRLTNHCFSELSCKEENSCLQCKHTGFERGTTYMRLRKFWYPNFNTHLQITWCLEAFLFVS